LEHARSPLLGTGAHVIGATDPAGVTGHGMLPLVLLLSVHAGTQPFAVRVQTTVSEQIIAGSTAHDGQSHMLVVMLGTHRPSGQAARLVMLHIVGAQYAGMLGDADGGMLQPASAQDELVVAGTYLQGFHMHLAPVGSSMQAGTMPHIVELYSPQFL